MRILLVDDEPLVLHGIKRLLPRDWDVVLATGSSQALHLLAETRFDVLVTDLHMPGLDGVALLREAQTQWPSMLRIISSGSCDTSQSLASVAVAHQYLSKPYDPATLHAAVERAVHMRHLVTDPSLARFTSGLQWLPMLPDSYQKITAALNDASTPLRKAGELVAQDLGLSAKLLQIVNSAFFGLPRHVASPAEAAVLLGGDILRSVVLAAEVFSNLEADERVMSVVHSLWQHSLATARTSRTVGRLLGCNREIEDAAFMSAMIHDVGSLVLLMNHQEDYLACTEIARQTDRPLHEVEVEVCGTTHAHVSGYLLSRWGLPAEIVTSTALHHRPQDADAPQLDSLTILHLADTVGDASSGGAAQSLSEQYLSRVGVAESLPRIRQAIEAAAP